MNWAKRGLTLGLMTGIIAAVVAVPALAHPERNAGNCFDGQVPPSDFAMEPEPVGANHHGEPGLAQYMDTCAEVKLITTCVLGACIGEEPLLDLFISIRNFEQGFGCFPATGGPYVYVGLHSEFGNQHHHEPCWLP